MAGQDFYRQLGTGVASLTFGVALSIFIYAAASGLVTGAPAWLLFLTSFLLMLRFWWRYSELFVQFLPSRTFWHFLFDFAISAFGISAVLFVGNIQSWAVLGAAAMLASTARCGLAWREAAGAAKEKLKRTLAGALVMAAALAAVWVLAPVTDVLALAGAVFVLVLAFTAHASTRP